MHRSEQPLDTASLSVDHPPVRRFVQIVLLLLLLGAGGGGWYFYHRGFSKPWREWVVDELRQRGFEVSFTRLTVEPFRGLVAKDVRIYDSPARRSIIAKVDEMVVEANYAHALHSEPFLDALTLVDASLQFPVDPQQPNGPFITVDKLNTRLHLPPGQLLLSHFEAEVMGIQISAAGQLANPGLAASRPKATSAGASGSSWPSRLVEELRALHFDGLPPRLEVRFSGDLQCPESLVIEVNLQGEKIRRNDYHLETLAATATWQNEALVVSHFEARDHVGRLQLSASYEKNEGTVEGRIRSGMDLPGLLRALEIKDFGEIIFDSVPQLDLTGSATLAGPHRDAAVQLIGQLRLGPFHYGQLPFDRLSGDFSWDGRRWAIRDVSILHRSGGELTLNAQQDYDAAGQGDFRLGLRSSLNPEVLAPYLQAQKTPEARLASARLAMFRFHDEPRINLSARGPSPLDCAASGEVVLGRMSYRGIEALKGHADLRYNGRVLNIDDCVVQRAEGIGGGALAFDFQRKVVEFKNVRTALHPTDVALWIDPELVASLQPYRFGKKPPNVLINGIIDLQQPPVRNALDVRAEAPGMDYTFCGKELHFTDLSGRLFFTERRLRMQDVHAEILGGTARGEGDISIIKALPGHTASLQFTDVDFARLTKLYFNYDESQGKLNATYDFTGAGDNGRTMRGTGALTVTDGNVFAIPFLGPFSEILNKIVPGMGFNKAHKASTSFTIADGVMTTKDLVIAGRGFSMIGDGKIWFMDDRMDCDMRINAQGLPGVLLFPVSKLFEYRADSKLSQPIWRPKVLGKLGGSSEHH